MLDYCRGCGGHPAGSPVGTVGFDTNAEAAWNAPTGFGSPGVIIAILDSGVDAGHPDINQMAGYDFGDNDANPDDNSASPGHGTACAGVAAAISSNGGGVSGIAGGCTIMPLKVANSAGSLFFSCIQNALIYAADNGADVASMSFSAAISSDPATDSALQYAFNAGVTLLAATSNSNESVVRYPAINTNVIAVGAASPCGGRKRSSSSPSELNPGVQADPDGYTCDGERWWGSNYGSAVQSNGNAVDIIAPTIMPTTDIQGSGGYIQSSTTPPSNPPVANFSGTPTSGDAPLSINFTDLSTNFPTSWSWNFGDAGTSTLQNPSHTYTSAGTYTVTLTATNAVGSDGETKVGYITVTTPTGTVMHVGP